MTGNYIYTHPGDSHGLPLTLIQYVESILGEGPRVAHWLADENWQSLHWNKM